MDDTSINDDTAQAPETVRLGSIITLYITGADTRDKVREAVGEVFSNFSIFDGFIPLEPDQYRHCYMVKIVTSMAADELLRVLKMIKDVHKISLGFEGNGMFYAVR
jgi:hypothetical protein